MEYFNVGTNTPSYCFRRQAATMSFAKNVLSIFDRLTRGHDLTASEFMYAVNAYRGNKQNEAELKAHAALMTFNYEDVETAYNDSTLPMTDDDLEYFVCLKSLPQVPTPISKQICKLTTSVDTTSMYLEGGLEAHLPYLCNVTMIAIDGHRDSVPLLLSLSNVAHVQIVSREKFYESMAQLSDKTGLTCLSLPEDTVNLPMNVVDVIRNNPNMAVEVTPLV